MTTCRLIYKNLARNGTIVDYSTEHPQFPVENMQDDMLVLPWRSRYGTGTGNGLFVIGLLNEYIDFDEGGAELTATLTPGNYSGQTLAAEIKTQMDSAGALTYTVTYAESTGLFTIAASGAFTLLWNSGSHTYLPDLYSPAAGMLGFLAGTDLTGGATYTGDTRVIHTVEYIDIYFGATYQYNSIAILNHNLTSNAVIEFIGDDDSTFDTDPITDPLTFYGNNAHGFITTRTKPYCRISVKDPHNPSGYVQIGVAIIGKYLQPNRNFGPYAKGPLDETELAYTPSNNVFTVQERPALENSEYVFTGLNATTKVEIKALLNECGIRKAFWLCTDYDYPNENSEWVKLKETALLRRESFNYWTWEMSVEQVL